ncbi:MAG TPA: trehalose-phosphatase [Nitrospiraceae bacterium]|nr:trehalose-phosphatase [Nitrospiraceae bacterium]
MVSLRARLAAIPTNRLILFLDFDGTLAPIVPHPNRARLSRPVRETLRKLSGLLPVVIISGRTPKDLRRRVGLQGLCYVGHHGLSCLEASGEATWLTTPPRRVLVRRWFQALRIAAEGIEGAFVEDKGMTVALHDRLVKPNQRSRLRQRARRLLAPWIARRSVSLLRGNHVLEARSPRAGNKGTAVSMLLRRPWARHRVPVYFGDDRTDFDAFSVIRGRGLAIRIGGRRGTAGEDAWMSDPKKLHSVLDWLSARRQDGTLASCA